MRQNLGKIAHVEIGPADRAIAEMMRRDRDRTVEGSVDTRHLVADAVGCPKSAASVCRLQRRTAIAIDPEASAASDNRRDDVIESRATSATTAPSPP
jgi:hypothetical protein